MATTTPQAIPVEQPVRPIIINDDTWLRPNQIARSRKHRSGIDAEPLLPITTAKLYKDVRAGLLQKPEKFGQASAWQWRVIKAAYGLSVKV